MTSATTTIIQFGSVTFSKDTIKSAVLLEEHDPISATLPIGTLTLTLYSDDTGFVLINPVGDYLMFQSGQPLVVYETIGSSSVLIGQFYVDVWENVSQSLNKLVCVDLLGILDKLEYNGGMWLNAVSLDVLLSTVLDGAGMAYELDPELDGKQVKGWIPICTYREALQQIAFAVGASVTCARQGGFIKISKAQLVGTVFTGGLCGVPSCGQSRIRARAWRPNAWVSNSDSGYLDTGVLCGISSCGQSRILAKKFRRGAWRLEVPEIYVPSSEKVSSGQSLLLKPQVTGVNVKSHDWVEGIESINLYEGVLSAGTHKIVFSKPSYNLSITGATIGDFGANYAWVTVATDGIVSLTGFQYTDTSKNFGVYMLGGYQKENVLLVPDAFLVSSSEGEETAQRVYDYYQQRYIQKSSLIVPVAAVGNLVSIDTFYSQHIRGVVERLETDLSLGFVASVSIVGKVG